MALKDFMARGERGVEAVEGMPRAVLGSVQGGPRTVSPSTSVDASSELEGKLRCKQTLRIDGYVKGEVECERSVLVGEGARVFASIAADEVQIAGVVEGDITARRKITLERTAIVKGDLTTPGIVIEEGAKVSGRIVIGSEVEAAMDAKAVQPLKKAVAAKPSEASPPQPLAATA
ncbi:MAG TPA: polymer-forming cytoskeletal protein [Myxococcota bacterium]|jgi:cytoskeletal protein CcmA (bactofilin family)